MAKEWKCQVRFKLQKIRKKRKRVKCRHRTPGCGVVLSFYQKFVVFLPSALA